MIILKLAWRNLWRNSKRSWITISAIATAFIFLISMSGLIGGLSMQMLGNGTELLTGHAQIHDAGYLPNRNLYDWLGEEPIALGPLMVGLENHPDVVAVAPRVYGFALLSTGERSYGAQLIGIRPEFEGRVSRILDHVKEGGLSDGGPKGEIVIGKTLASSLGVELGEELAVVSQAADGAVGNDLFRVAGIVDVGISHLNRMLAVAHLQDVQELLALEDWQIHEIVLRTVSPLKAPDVCEKINSSGLLPSDSIAESWSELLPQLKEYLRLAEGMGWFTIALVGVFAAFGTLNTMMMAVFERTREVGNLSAMGVGPRQILSVFLVESFFLGVTGLAVGFLAGGTLLYHLSTQGLNLTRWTGEFTIVNSRVDPVLKAEWMWGEMFWAAVGLMLAVLLATVIPSVRAARMDPVEALRAPSDG